MLFLGSCFAENIGIKMANHKFPIEINPTGISYNPISLAENIRQAVNQKSVTSADIVQNGEQFVHFDFHSRLGHFDADICLSQINRRLVQLHKAIHSSNLIFISLGSAVAFEHIKNQKIVSNCHKFPQEYFKKRQLKHVEISDSLNSIIHDIHHLNPQAQFVFTISPVRHSRHGLIENNRSKANLISAVHDLVEQHKALHYFPSYEIIVDDLRDYRFYNRDLVHPSEEAIEYIWSYFKDQYLDDQTKVDLESIKSLVNMYNHKALTTSPHKRIQFLNSLKDKMSHHPYQDRFAEEITDINNQITEMSTP